MKKTKHLIVFKNISLQYPHPPCKYFKCPHFNSPGSRENRYKFCRIQVED